MAIESPISTNTEYFTNPLNGKPLSNGFLYVGNQDTDPAIEANRVTITVIQEDGTRVPILPEIQPLTIFNGRVHFGGQRVVAVADDTVAVKITDKNGKQIDYFPRTNSYPLATDLASTANGKGASLVAIEDSSGIFDATTVENALTEVKGNYAPYANKAEAVTKTLINAAVRFIGGTDGGWFKEVTGAAPGTYSDNGGAYCGTVFIPTGGDGSSAYLREYIGSVFDTWFGFDVYDGISDDAPAIQYLFDNFSDVEIFGNRNISTPLVLPSGSPSRLTINGTWRCGAAMGAVLTIKASQGSVLKGQLTVNCRFVADEGVLFEGVSGYTFDEIITNQAKLAGVAWSVVGNNNSVRGNYIRASECGRSGTTAYVKDSDVSTTSLSSQRSILTAAVDSNATGVLIDNKYHKVEANSGTTIDIWPLTTSASGTLKWIYGGGIDFRFSGDNNVANIAKIVAISGRGFGLRFAGVFGNNIGSYSCENTDVGLLIGSSITSVSIGNAISHLYFENNDIDIAMIGQKATVNIKEAILESATTHYIWSLYKEAAELSGLGTGLREFQLSALTVGGTQMLDNKFALRIISSTAESIPIYMDSILFEKGSLTSDFTLTLSPNLSTLTHIVSNFINSFSITLHDFGVRNVILAAPSGFTIEGGATHTLTTPGTVILHMELYGTDYKVIT